jgi:hypothetical protein
MTRTLIVKLRFKAQDWRPAYDAARPSRYPSHFPPEGISGVYLIADMETGRCLYVGESHSNKLRLAMARHFRQWIDKGEPRVTFDRRTVQVAWAQTEPEDALLYEAALIHQYQPTENKQFPVELDAREADESGIGERAPAATGDVPF